MRSGRTARPRTAREHSVKLRPQYPPANEVVPIEGVPLRAVFGLRAAVYASQISAQAPVIVADTDGALDALAEAVRRRRAGEFFAVWPIVFDQRAVQALDIAANLEHQFAGYDEERKALAALAAGELSIDGRPQHEVTFVDPRSIATLYDVVRLGTRTIAQTWIEAQRLRALFPALPEIAIVPPRVYDPLVPSGIQASGAAVVVWAPRLAPRDCTIFALALREMRVAVTIIAHDASEALHGARVVGPNGAADALRDARVIVDATLGKPSTATVLAGMGAALCVSSTTGAAEYIAGARVYDPWDASSIRDAVTMALGDLQPICLCDAQEPPPLALVPEDPADGPLVSIIVRTRDRPEFLARALASIAAQHYRTVEAIVVNDGGVDVRDVVARFPFVRLVTHDRSRGRSAAANAGFAAATGMYAGLLDDDDVLFPDHAGALVGALQRSGSMAAASGAISAFARKSVAGYVVDGYRITLAGHVDRIELHTEDRIPPMGVLVRRDVLQQTGGFHEELAFAEDWEMWLRISAIADIVNVPRITAMYTVRRDDANAMSAPGADYARTLRYMQQRYPLAGMPEREAVRQAMIDRYTSGDVITEWPEPALRFVPAEPLAWT